MSQVRTADSAFKLFGKTISLPTEKSDDADAQSLDRDSSSTKKLKKDEESESCVSNETTLKKPDKILSCPRCNSNNTKFCYYNNYNVNQPRHFCKNCQRYWTAGGTMRNVPVGSGRRRNKNVAVNASNYREIMVEALHEAARRDAINGVHLRALKPEGFVMTFGSTRPVCDSMASVLNLREKSQNCASIIGRELGNDQLSGISCITELNSKEKGNAESGLGNVEGFGNHEQSFLGLRRASPWNSALWMSPMSPPAFSPLANSPVSFYPAAAHWGCKAPSALNSTSNLGKHSRDGSQLKTQNSREKHADKHVPVPMTLRINDPKEAITSSLWPTYGIRKAKGMDSIKGAHLFPGFYSKRDQRNNTDNTSLVLQANPAALSRSLYFREQA